MIDLDREALRRDLSDALRAIQEAQDVPRLEGLPARPRTLEPAYQYHAPLLQVAIQKQDTLAIMWNLVQLVDKLERGVS